MDIVYRVDDRDQIVFVNDEWDRFALANSGAAVTSSFVLHRPLWDFIADIATQELYRQVLRRSREGHSLRFTFRCDSPDCRRLLEMNVERSESNSVEFRTQTVSLEPRPPVVFPDSASAATEELLRACGWCKKVHVGGAWVEAEEAIVRLGLFLRQRLTGLTHGICEACYDQMTKSLLDS